MALQGSITLANVSDGQSGQPGPPGPSGASVTSARELYYFKTNSQPVPFPPTNVQSIDVQNQWTSVVPSYTDGGIYYTCIESTLDEEEIIYSAPSLNQALTNENKNAYDALIAAGLAEQRTAKIINNNSGVTVAAGDTNFDPSDVSTYKYNTIMAPNFLGLRYNAINLTKLSVTGIELYYPTIQGGEPIQGTKSIEINQNGTISLYKPGVTNAVAVLGTDGFVTSKGGIKFGEGTSNFVYLSTDNYGSNLTINGHQASNWKEIIGTNFGVDENGHLYATDIDVAGKITIGAGSNVYTKTEADDAFDVIGSAEAAQAAAAIDATNKANAAQSAAEATAAADATAKANTVNSALESYKTTTNSTLENLQRQVDGQIEVWYYSVDPTLNNPPASSWNTEELKARHEGDLYYNIDNGHSWRWMKNGTSYNWQQIPDGDAAAALALAQSAENLAKTKRRIFTVQPTPPYDIGDLWVDGSQVKYCNTSRSEGSSYVATDWILTATDDTKANSAVKKTQRIYYQNNSSTPPNPPGTNPTTDWVTDQSGDSGKWTLKRMSYSSSNKYIWTCEQSENNAETVLSYTPVLLDDTTTVIDGGSIITGSIDANRIKTSSLIADLTVSGAITTNANRTSHTSINQGVTITSDGISAGSGTERTFYVNNDGTLYVSGNIQATSLTIGTGANAYDGYNAINITGYSISIVRTSISTSTTEATLTAYLYHNGVLVSSSSSDPGYDPDYNPGNFLWYQDSGSTAYDVGQTTTAAYGHIYRAAYAFDNGDTQGATPIQNITVDPSKYITPITTSDIKIHPEVVGGNSYLRINPNGIYLSLNTTTSSGIDYKLTQSLERLGWGDVIS